MEYYFKESELLLIYNALLSYLTFRFIINIPTIKSSTYISLIYIYYGIMLLYFGGLVFTMIYFNKYFGLNNMEIRFLKQRQLQNIIYFTTIINIIDFIGILILYTYSFISHEYYDIDKNHIFTNKNNEERKNYNENEQNDEYINEYKSDNNKSISESISTESLSSCSTSSFDFNNNLSEECINDIKKILFNSDSRQIRLLIRTINKHLSN